MLGLSRLFGGAGRQRDEALPVYRFAYAYAGRAYDITVSNACSLTEARTVLANAQEVTRDVLATPPATPGQTLALPAPDPAPAKAEAAPVRVLATPAGHPPLATLTAKASAKKFDQHLRDLGRTGLMSVSELENLYMAMCRDGAVHPLAWPALATELRPLWGPSTRRRCGEGGRETVYNIPAVALVAKRRVA